MESTYLLPDGVHFVIVTLSLAALTLQANIGVDEPVVSSVRFDTKKIHLQQS